MIRTVGKGVCEGDGVGGGVGLYGGGRGGIVRRRGGRSLLAGGNVRGFVRRKEC